MLNPRGWIRDRRAASVGFALGRPAAWDRFATSVAQPSATRHRQLVRRNRFSQHTVVARARNREGAARPPLRRASRFDCRRRITVAREKSRLVLSYTFCNTTRHAAARSPISLRAARRIFHETTDSDGSRSSDDRHTRTPRNHPLLKRSKRRTYLWSYRDRSRKTRALRRPQQVGTQQEAQVQHEDLGHHERRRREREGP